MPHSKDSILELLGKLGVEQLSVEHAAAPTCEVHTSALAGSPLAPYCAKGQAKNLFFKVPSGGGKLKNRLFLVCALVDTVVDAKALSARLGIKASAPMRFADAKLFDEVLQVPSGSVTAFVMANESTKDVTLLLDSKFKNCEKLLFHPMRNDWTTAISPAGLDTFIKGVGADARTLYVDLPSTEEIPLPEEGEAPAAPAAKTAPKKEQPKEKKDHGPKEQDFAPDHMFVFKKTWEETAFLYAHQQWLARSKA